MLHSKITKTSEGGNKSPKKKETSVLPAYKAEDLKLPKKFAEQVLELEMNVEHNVFTIKQIQRLMALYSKAVEFYNGKSDSKYLYYQDKIQNLITQPKVLDMLSSKTNVEPEREKPEERVETDPKTKEQLKKKERQLKMNLHLSNKQMEKQDVKTKIIEDHTSTKDKESKIVENNLSEQSDNLKKRLEERKRRMTQKEAPKETENGSHLTNSSTPNLTLSSKKVKPESEDKIGSKSDSSGTNSVGDTCTFQFNLGNLQDDKFSDELMDRLKLLQEGYDDNDYDDDDLFDEGAVEEEIEKILTKCEEEVEKILEEDRSQIEALYERIANEKFEKLAEIKAEYKYKLKFSTDEEEKEQMTKEMEEELAQTNLKYAKLKEEQIQELKLKHKANKERIKIKKESIKQVTNRVRRSVSRKASRRVSGLNSPKNLDRNEEHQSNFTNIMPIRNKDQLKDDLSKGLNSNKEFCNSFRMPKGPLNIHDLVRQNQKE